MNSKYTRTSRGADQRQAKLPHSNQTLFDKTLSPENLEQAWKRVRANKGVAGIDGLTIDDFPAYWKAHGQPVLTLIRSGNYKPYPVKRCYIEKDDGSLRALGIPTILDRIIQQAIVQTLTPIFDVGFSNASYGFRPNRSQHQAVYKVQEHIKSGRKFVVDVDLSKFFDRVNHDLLMTLIGRKIKDKALLRLIGKYLRAGVVDDGVQTATREGVPQGGPLSPLLSNIMLDVLDKELEARGHTFVRYADDFVIMVKSQSAGERVMASITTFIEKKLKLVINDQKSQVVSSRELEFLGFMFKNKNIQWSPKAELAFKHEVRNLTSRSWGVSVAHKIQKLSVYLRGWINYFGIANRFQHCVDLDQWIRRRLRMCYWKQWRKIKTKVGNLIRLGVNETTARACGASRKGYCRSSKTWGIHQAISEAFLEKQGLFSLVKGWIKIHHG